LLICSRALLGRFAGSLNDGGVRIDFEHERFPTRARQLPRRQLVSSGWLRIARVPSNVTSARTPLKKRLPVKKRFQSDLVHSWLDTSRLCLSACERHLVLRRIQIIQERGRVWR
jgi:hypothetical protein